MDKLFLLDAYALIYRSYYAFIKAPRINSKGLNTSCIMGFCNTLNEILTKEKPTHIAVAFDHGKTFRHEAFLPIKPSEKRHRKTSNSLYQSSKTYSKPTTFLSSKWMVLRLMISLVL